MTRQEAILLLNDMKDTYDEIHENTNYEIGYEQMTALDMAIEALHREEAEEKGYCHRIRPKAKAEPTVIRSRTLMPTKDFKEWAKRIREENPNAVVIPCDAEVISAEAVQGWIPCSERMPKELEAVNVTWVNHNPPLYYQHIKDVPKADMAVYYRGAWYWWDATVIDLLGEYGGAYIHGIEPIDKDIEVTAWMPLPTPYKGGDDDGKD